MTPISTGLAVNSHADAARARSLRTMKLIALALLIGAAAVYVVATLAGADGVWGYVQAFAEAAMVGALADWFAVTALFRHPLGLPIPHTAIIPNRKDQIGASLGEFVEENFLTVEVIDQRLAQAGVAQRLGEWLAVPANASRASAAIGDGLGAVLGAMDDTDIQQQISAAIERRLESIDVAPLAARLIDASIEDGFATQAIDGILTGIDNFLGDSKETFRNKMHEESPWWVPPSLDNAILDKIYDVVRRFLAEVKQDPDHEVRRTAVERLATFADRLRTDPEWAARGKVLQSEVLQNPEVRAWIDSTWGRIKVGAIDMGTDSGSELRVGLARSIEGFGRRLSTDPELRRQADSWVSRGVAYMVGNYRSEVSHLIATTVQNWDTESTARRVELQVGRDLQFIRINGTLVGGIAGLVIHALTEIL